MPQLRSKGSRFAIVVAGFFFPLLPSNAQDSQSQIAEPAPAQTERRDLYLEVFINDVSTQLVGTFTQFPDGGLAATADELKQVGLKPVDDAVGGDGLVRLDRLPNVAFRIDGPSQRLYVTTTNDGRAARVVDVAGSRNEDRIEPQAGYGGVLNYSLFASSNRLFEKDVDLFQGISGGFDARVFSPFGTLSQGFIAGYSDGEFGGFTRLNTTWSYSDPKRLMTYRAATLSPAGSPGPGQFISAASRRSAISRYDLIWLLCRCHRSEELPPSLRRSKSTPRTFAPIPATFPLGLFRSPTCRCLQEPAKRRSS